MKNEHHYTVKNTTVEHPNINNHPTSYYLTRIYEDHDTYQSIEQQDHSPYNHNVVQKAFINVIFAKQVHEVAFAQVKDDEEYRTAEEKCSRIFSQLRQALTTEEQKHLLLELESAWHGMHGIFLEYSYCQGLADSKMIHKQLEKYGISITKETSEYHYALPA